MIKKSIRDMMSGAEDEVSPDVEASAAEGQVDSEEGGRRRSAPLNSPLLNRRGTAQTPFKSRVLPLPLPVTGGEVSLRFEELDPRSCSPSPMNPRVQTLLSMNDPEVCRIARSIEQEGQREPVLARVLREGDELRYEVIYGTTRLFIADQLGIKVKAWVGEIPDADARRLARAENAERRDLSAWEKGTDIKRMMETLYAGRTQEFVAEQEGLSRPQLTKLLRIADLDLNVVSLLKSPMELSITSGPPLLTLLESADPKQRLEALSKADEGAPYATCADLLKTLRSFLSTPVETAGSKRKPIVLERSRGKPIMKVTPHRQHAGQYKVDFFEFSSEDIECLMAFVKERKGL